ncbi:MAG: hypothetical protein KME15_19425 [Drouetiella hepatica Uher 2000/2452]|jgi:uncharacterized protein (TIGR02588 family)|uniref:TIGR02588 family protein n=1 Tax=Drouetiella hepatica Uher 2000/2452 TaxID=904376 RepID=A0A951QE14_9CYAN|nr:hypothetical protein [Drouetiella hepatica Uher 2000/2452]
MTNSTGKKIGTDPRTKAEQVSLAIALALLAGVIGIVISLWLNSSGEPARFRVDRGLVRNEVGVYYLPITVTNEGAETGAQVTVAGKLRGTDDLESTTTFDFISGGASVTGVLVFQTEPTSAEIRVVGYQQP